jgi:cytochrome c biogenesis protein CcdA/glutaredoxin
MPFKKSILTLLAILFVATPSAFAQSLPVGSTDQPAALAIACKDPVMIEVFERKDCGHCQDEKEFLSQLQKERNDLVINYHDIGDPEHKAHFLQLMELEKLPKVTPVTLIDGVLMQGFDTAKTTGKKIRALVDQSKGKPQRTFEEYIAAGGSGKIETEGGGCTIDGDTVQCSAQGANTWVTLPFVGTVVDVSKYSLPLLSLILGFVDGFNPCAMWALVMFLTLLAEVGSRRRMFEMAGLFILAQGIMYYLILNVWMTTWDFVGLDRIVTPIIGLVAVGAGGYFLYQFYKKDSTCKVGSLESKQKTREKIKGYASAPMTIAVALGIVGLALSINIIEFACSVGIPQTFTKVLDMNYLDWAGKQFYNFLYILMYMIDDLVIFALALFSFEKIGLTTHKYTRASHFIGGLIMVVLGVILLVKPTLLVF